MAARKPLLSFAEFVNRGIVLVEDSATTNLRPMQLYPLQRQFVRDVWDTYGKDGRRRYRRAVFSTVKKGGKTSFAALQGVYHLTMDSSERRREIISISGDKDQASLTMKLGALMIKRSPLLSGFAIDLQKDRIVYTDEDGEEHVWMVLASDSGTAHGLNPSLVLCDETWLFRDYSLLEAVALGPQRWHPLTLFTTYAGLKSDQVKGHPLWDLYQTGMDGTDPALYFTWREGEEAYDEFPAGFIRPNYLPEQKRALPENRYKRLHENRWSSGDVGFLSDEEIARATDAARGVPDRSTAPTVLALDMGRVRDHAALLAAQRDAVNGKVVPVHAQAIEGTPQDPVRVSAMENAALAVCERLNVTRIICDPWQMIGSAERLADRLGFVLFEPREGLEAPRADGVIILQPFTSAYVNRLAKGLLSLFRNDDIVIPGSDPGCQDLLTQLAAVVAVETYLGIRIDSGRGSGVKGHDDLVVALAMAATAIAARSPYIELPAYFPCSKDLSLGHWHDRGGPYWNNCAVNRPGGRFWPLMGSEGEVCRKHCRGWAALKAAHKQAKAAGETIGIDEFNRTRIYRPPSAAVCIPRPHWM